MTIITDQLGRVLAGRYRLDAGLGTGASAHVYAAFDARLSRRVAVKLLHPGLSGDRAFLRRFQAEAQAVAALSHPNLVRVFDWGEEEDGPFLVLEYLGGGSLRDLLDTGARLTPAQAAHVGAGAAHGLAYAHRRGLVHRDVKPANLLFDEEGRVRVADFGLARALAEAAWTEPAGAVLGTARYASPEQAEGRPLEDRSDVYSLALVLFEAVTGRVPFSGDTTFATLMARVGAVLPPAPELGPISPILAQAAIGEPLARLDAEELAMDLELAARTLPRPGPLPLAPKLVRPGRGPLDDRPPDAGRRGQRPSAGAFDQDAARPRRAGARVFDGELATATVAPAPAPAGASPFAAAPPAAPPGFAAADGAGRAAADLDLDLDLAGDEEPEQDAAGGWVPPRRPAGRGRCRWRRRLVVALVVVVVLGGGAAAAIRFVVLGHEVPRLAGLRLAAARAATGRSGLHLQVRGRAYSATVPAGAVISQSPGAGKLVRSGSDVGVEVSEGHAPVPVPGVAGRTRAAALAALQGAHLVPAVSEAYSETVAAGVVIAASPPGGSAGYGSTVHVQVSEGPHPRTVPELGSAATWASASAALRALKLVPVEALTYSNAVPAGEVIATAPAEGAQGIPVGTKVTVTVSRGPRLVTVPTVANQPIDSAIALLQHDGLNVTEQVGPPFATHATTTDPAPGARVRPGTSVTLYVA